MNKSRPWMGAEETRSEDCLPSLQLHASLQALALSCTTSPGMPACVETYVSRYLYTGSQI